MLLQQMQLRFIKNEQDPVPYSRIWKCSK